MTTAPGDYTFFLRIPDEGESLDRAATILTGGAPPATG